MTLLIVSTLVSLVVLPLLALFWLVRRSPSVISWGLKAAAVGAYVLATVHLGGWQMLSVYGRVGLLGLFGVAAAVGAWRMRGAPVWKRPNGWQWAGVVGAGIVVVVCGIGLGGVYRSQQVPPDPVDLQFPLRDGAFYVASGGSQALMNPHMKVAQPGLEHWRGQLWALDIVELYPSGNRARGLYPTALDRFAIFDTPVYAPCDGQVAAVETTLPDLVPPARDTTNKAGNYVMLRCGPQAYVLLAHLKQKSVTVQPGDAVSVGARLGAIGNSGNSWEPHLHVNAQRGPGDATILDTAPRPMTFDGRFPTRNDVLRPPPK